MSTSENNIASTAFDPLDLNQQNKQITSESQQVPVEKIEDKTSVKEEDKLEKIKLAAVSEKFELGDNSSGEMPNKTAPSRRLPHLHKLEK